MVPPVPRVGAEDNKGNCYEAVSVTRVSFGPFDAEPNVFLPGQIKSGYARGRSRLP